MQYGIDDTWGLHKIVGKIQIRIRFTHRHFCWDHIPQVKAGMRKASEETFRTGSCTFGEGGANEFTSLLGILYPKQTCF